MLIQYFNDFHDKLDQIIDDYESDYHAQQYKRINTADPSWFDEQIQFYNDMKHYCEINGYKEVNKIMTALKPYYTRSPFINFFKQHSSSDKAEYL